MSFSEMKLPETDFNFRESVYALVLRIPSGRVMSYGQVAALCDNPQAARIVGGIAHYGPEDLPWQRVVKKDGGLASGYYGGPEGHKLDLEREGVEIIDYKVINMDSKRWWPDE